MLLRKSTIAFPGLGIGEFEVDSVAFSIGSVDIAWYALIIVTGIIAAVAYIIYRSGHIGVRSEDIIDAAIFVVPAGIIGARLYYVLTSLDNYDTFMDVINIRNGGIAIYGAIIGGALAVIGWCKVKKINFFAIADCISPGLILAQSIGRWGNFMNGEAFGSATDIFCRIQLKNGNTLSIFQTFDAVCVHPTFLYESLWNILGFALINIFYKKKQYDGQVFLAVFGWYGLGRMFIEGLRTDSLWIGPFRISQVLAGLIFISCLAILIYLAVKPPKKEFFKYTSKYEKAALLKTAKKAQSQEASENAPANSKEEVTDTAVSIEEVQNENNKE